MKAANTIKNLRAKLVLDQPEFAQKLDISPSAISHYERGSRVPRINIIRKMIQLAKDNKIKLSLEDFV